jgi:hypothetical protein
MYLAFELKGRGLKNHGRTPYPYSLLDIRKYRTTISSSPTEHESQHQSQASIWIPKGRIHTHSVLVVKLDTVCLKDISSIHDEYNTPNLSHGLSVLDCDKPGITSK